MKGTLLDPNLDPDWLSRPAKLLKGLVGTRRLELLTSTVSR